MRVLHVIPSIAPVRGGTSQVTLELVESIRDRGVDAEIATTNDAGSDLLDVPLARCVEYQNIPVWFFPRLTSKFSPLQEFTFSSQLTNWLQKQVKQYDLLHIHAIFSYPSIAAMQIARQQNIPYIVNPHGALCEWSLTQSALKKKIYLQFIREHLNRSQYIHFAMKREQREAANLKLSSASFVLPYGVHPSLPITNAREQLRSQLHLDRDEPIILFMSRLHHKKGLEYLIPALGKLTHHRFTFVVAGSGHPEYEAEIRQLLTNHGILNRTKMTGFVAGEFKNLLIQGADLFTLTSHSENFGMCVLESLATGVPVVVTPGVALADIVREHQLGWVPELNIDAIASNIDQALSNSQQLTAMGNRASQIGRDYTWNHLSRNLVDIYRQITNAVPVPQI